jgi:hypothetical protein
MCAQKLGQPSESGHLAIASRRRSSVRERSSSSMTAIASLRARLKKMLVQSAGGMSAGAESGRSARIGGARLIKPTFPPDFGRTVDGHLFVVLFSKQTSVRGWYCTWYDRKSCFQSPPHHVNRDYHRTDPHHVNDECPGGAAAPQHTPHANFRGDWDGRSWQACL